MRNWSKTPNSIEHLKEKTIWSDNHKPMVSYQASFPKDYQGKFGSPMKVTDPPDLPNLHEALLQENVFGEQVIEKYVDNLVSVEKLYKAKWHLGHASSRRHPQMNKYVFGERYGMDIIDLDQTIPRLKAALNVLGNSAFRKGKICIICENPRYRHEVDRLAEKIGQYSIDVVTASTNKRFNHAFLTGEKMPDVFIFVGVLNQSQVAASPFIDLANRVHSCTIGLVDTDVNPTGITYRIPGNDDSKSSVNLFLEIIHDVITEGYKLREDFIKAIEEAQKKESDEDN